MVHETKSQLFLSIFSRSSWCWGAAKTSQGQKGEGAQTISFYVHGRRAAAKGKLFLTFIKMKWEGKGESIMTAVDGSLCCLDHKDAPCWS